MKSHRRKPEDRRASPSDRIMYWLSSGKRSDGLWVGTYFQSHRDEILGRVQEALGLIKTYDQRRYRRRISDLDRVWVGARRPWAS